MAEKIHPSRGFHFDVDDPSSVSKTPSFNDFSVKTRPANSRGPPASSSPPRRSWADVPAPPADDDKSLAQPSGTFVIQFPKEQIFSHPPAENSVKFETLSRQKPRRSRCCSCLCYTLVFLLILVIIVAAAAVIFYLVLRPVEPEYSVSGVTFRGFNLTSSSPFSPAIDVIIQAENPNKKIGIYYLAGSEVEVSYDGVMLGNGVLPEFFQPAKNVTDLKTAVKGSNVALVDGVRSAMRKKQSEKKVPLRVDVKAPVKIKAAGVKTWTINVKVKCDVTVDSINGNSKILSKKCDYKLKLW